MNAKHTFAACLLSSVLCGCGDNERWIERRLPTTDEERKLCAEHVEKIISQVPRTLSGHDQDWDDAIAQAHYQATMMLCRPTLWQLKDGDFTGQWKYYTNQ